MKISDLLIELKKVLNTYGDLPVFVDSEDVPFETPVRQDFLEVLDEEDGFRAGVVHIPARPKRLYIG